MLLNRKEIITLPNNGNIFVMGTSGRLRQHGGKALPLFDKIKDRTNFKLFKTKTLGSGSIVLYYGPYDSKQLTS